MSNQQSPKRRAKLTTEIRVHELSEFLHHSYFEYPTQLSQQDDSVKSLARCIGRMHAKERKSELTYHEVDTLLHVDPNFFSQDRLGHCRKQSPWNQHLSMTSGEEFEALSHFCDHQGRQYTWSDCRSSKQYDFHSLDIDDISPDSCNYYLEGSYHN